MTFHVQRNRRPRSAIAVLILVVAVVGPSIVRAQVPSRSLTTFFAPGREPVAAVEPDTKHVFLLAGRSTIVEIGSRIERVSLTSADIADALVTSESELLVNGKMPGTISMFVWDRAGAIRRYEVVVQRDIARLAEQMRQLFPGEPIEVRASGQAVVLSGIVSSKDVADKAASLATSFVGRKEELVSLVQVRDDTPSTQVLLRVRFAEVSRSALTELGLSLFTSPTGVKNTIGRATTEQYAAPGFSELQYSKKGTDFGSDVTGASGKFTFSDFLNLFLFSEKYDLGAMVRALQTRGLFQSLAEPNLVAESGKDASFLAGGEFPIPIAQASAAGTAITVQFKEFGIRLSFTPTVTGDRIRLKVRPEVSTLDFNNAIVLQGFRIPALSTRRTETELELQNHQTFAIAGLINNTMISSMQKIPGIGDIPILGLLFRSKAAQKDQTELVVMITPEILPNNSRGVAPTLPRLAEPYLPPLSPKKSLDPPPPAFQPSGPASGSAAPGPSPADVAAATVSALTPSRRTVVNAGPQPTTPAVQRLTPQEQQPPAPRRSGTGEGGSSPSEELAKKPAR